MSKKIYDDDDGRTIADMSGIERRPLLIPKFKKKSAPPEGEEQAQKPAWEDDGLSKKERGALIGGTLGAALLVLAVFAAAIALVIVLIMVLGH